MKIRSALLAFLVAVPASLSATDQDADQWRIPNPWNTDELEKPPKIKPYKLPRFDESYDGDQHTMVPPIKHSPAIDAEMLWGSVLACYPAKSKFRLEIDLESSYRNRRSFDVTGEEIGQFYAGIVARMPLYSASELDREREREHMRRDQTAQTIGSLLAAVADRDHAVREMGLYSSLEARSQIRVQQGIAETAEQVSYLEKVAAAQAKLIQSEAAIIQHRLSLISMCADDKADNLNAFIKNVTAR